MRKDFAAFACFSALLYVFRRSYRDLFELFRDLFRGLHGLPARRANALGERLVSHVHDFRILFPFSRFCDQNILNFFGLRIRISGRKIEGS